MLSFMDAYEKYINSREKMGIWILSQCYGYVLDGLGAGGGVRVSESQPFLPISLLIFSQSPEV